MMRPDSFSMDNDIYFKQLNVETVLAAGAYPASGSYIDVSPYERFGFLVFIGTSGSACTATMQQATSGSGTLKDITGGSATIAAADDNKDLIFECQQNELDINNGYRYVCLTLAGNCTGTYAAIVFYGIMPTRVPVTQGAAASASPVRVLG
jgi:hypothetical protein